MENQNSVAAQKFRERGGEKRMRKRFGEIDLSALSLFKEQTQRAGVKRPVVTDEIFPGVFDIAVLGDTLGQHVIGGFIGEEEIFLKTPDIEKKRSP